LFVGAGQTGHDLRDFKLNQTRVAGGAGIRFRIVEKEKLSLRFDYGFGDRGDRGFYVSATEAF